jgi:hypothetical protein
VVKDVINNAGKSMLSQKCEAKQLKDPKIGRQRIGKEARWHLAHVRLKKYGGAKLTSNELSQARANTG